MTIPGRQSYNGAYYGAGADRLRQVFRGRTVSMQVRGFENALAKLQQMQEACKDISPVFIETLGEFTRQQRARFDARMTPDDPPSRWGKLNKKYAKWKYEKVGKRIANLVLSGRLRDAVFGGPGWFAEIGQTTAEWGIKGIPYAAAHQFGYSPRNLPARPFFVTSDGNMPKAVVNYMVSKLSEYIIGAL